MNIHVFLTLRTTHYDRNAHKLTDRISQDLFTRSADKYKRNRLDSRPVVEGR